MERASLLLSVCICVHRWLINSSRKGTKPQRDGDGQRSGKKSGTTKYANDTKTERTKKEKEPRIEHGRNTDAKSAPRGHSDSKSEALLISFNELSRKGAKTQSKHDRASFQVFAAWRLCVILLSGQTDLSTQSA